MAVGAAFLLPDVLFGKCLSGIGVETREKMKNMGRNPAKILSEEGELCIIGSAAAPLCSGRRSEKIEREGTKPLAGFIPQ